MRGELVDVIQKMQGQKYCLATVIAVHGSSSARTGSKAVFDSTGTNVFGWVGGGCAERFVAEQSLEALAHQQSRIVTANLDDEIFGLGIACGGSMDVFIEPVYPEEIIALDRYYQSKEQAEFLARSYGLQIRWAQFTRPLENMSELLLHLAQQIAKARGRSANSLRELRSLPAHFSSLSLKAKFPERLRILGRGRISEALARLAILLGWDVQVVAPSLETKDYPQAVKCLCLMESYDEFKPESESLVVIASHHAQDPHFVDLSLRAGARYVGMVGSRKRALEVLQHLQIKSDQEIRLPLFIPAGLDIDARTPEEIALSIVAELIFLQNPKGFA